MTPKQQSQNRKPSDRTSPGVFLGKSIVEAAKMLLAAKRQPIRNPDIAAALSAGGLVLNSKEPANTIGSVLGRRANDVGDIVKVGRGTWGLREWYPGRSFGKKDAPKGGNGGKPDENSKVASVAVARIPFMITQVQRARLRKLGRTDEEIKEMTPDEAHGILGGLPKVRHAPRAPAPPSKRRRIVRPPSFLRR
jgi:hypothetical protein